MISEKIQGTMGKVSKDGQRQLAPSSKSKHQKDKDERKKGLSFVSSYQEETFIQQSF